MKTLMIALAGLFVSFNCFAGGASGGGGVRPSMSFKASSNIDIEASTINFPKYPQSEFLKVVGVTKSGDVLFKFKRDYTDRSTLYQDNIEAVPNKYKQAIESSARMNKWVEVPKE